MPKADIEAIKAAHPILDVLRDLGIAVQHGRFRCLRPENHSHGDRTPSVSIWPERGAFKCWVCPDVKGDVIDLVRLARNCSFPDALAFLGGINPPPAFAAQGRAAPPPEADRAPAGAAASAGAGARAGTPARRDAISSPPSPVPPKLPSEADEAEETALRQSVLAALLEACAPVGGAAGRYLAKRRIFKRTWDAQRLRMIDDYAGISRKLESVFGLEALSRLGFFNAAGHLRFYRHILLFPYYDVTGRAAYMQARAIDPDAKPKELSLSGPIPMPYNARLLDGEPGQVFLCEGAIDTLTLLEQGFPAVGIPGAANFKAAWAPLFRNKVVHVAFDPDAPGESGAAKAIERLHAMGIEARRLSPPTGKDLNEWFRRG
jgi:DNA primase